MKQQFLKTTFSTLIVSVLWGGVNAQVGIGTTSPSNDLDVESNSANATAVDINCTGAGDPKINLQLNDATTFSIGVDNSDADKFKIGTSALETNTRLTIDASGNCGIGTTTPSAKLDVDGSAIFNESGAAVNFRVESDTNANMLFVNGTSNLIGIGTSNPTASLDVAAGGVLIGHSNPIVKQGLHLQWNRDNFSGKSYILNQLGLGIGAGIVFGKTTNSDVITEQMFISESGNVGIGTSSPTSLLHVNGSTNLDGTTVVNETGAAVNFRVESDASTDMLFVDGTNNRVGIGTSNPTVGLDVAAGGVLIGYNNLIVNQGFHLQWNRDLTGKSYILNQRGIGSGGIVFGKTTTSDVITEQMFISESGNVGIGTSLPTQALDIETNEAGGTALDINNIGGGDPKINFQLNGASTFSIGIDNDDADKFKIGTTAPETNTRLTIDNTGNVGVGTYTPESKLDVAGGINTHHYSTIGSEGLHLQWNKSVGLGRGYILNQRGAGSGGISFGKSTMGDVITEQMFLSDGGYLGIGTTSPTSLLHVNGSTNLDGTTVVNETGAAVNFRVESDANANMLFVDGTNNRVGIGTSNPTASLDVVGGVLVAAFNPIVNQGLHLQWNKECCLGRSYILNQGGGGGSLAGIVFGKATTSDVITEQMFISESGNVGIGTTTPAFKLTVNGQPAANGFTAFTNYSDSRLKTNITNLDTGALSKIMQLRTVSFQYNQKYLQLYPNSDLQKVHKGFIAQEIRQVFPEMVSEMKTSPDSVQYLDLDVSHLQVYLVKALQEQQAIINAQKSEIDAQKAAALLQKAEIDALKENALKVADLENKMNAMLLLLNNKTDVTAKQ